MTVLHARAFFCPQLPLQEQYENAPFASLDNMPLDPNRGAVIVTLVNKPAAEY